MNKALQNLCMTSGAFLALGIFPGITHAERPSRLAVTQAVEHAPFSEAEKQERLTELRTQVQTFFEAQEYDKAFEVLKQISALDPTVGPAHTRMAVLLGAVGLAQGVRTQLEEAVKSTPEDPEAYIRIAQIAIQESRLAEATLLLGRAQQLLEEYKGPEVRKEALETELSETLALYSEIQEDWRGLLGIFQYQEKRDPQNAELKVRIGLVYLKMKDERTGMAKFREARELDSEILPPETLAAEFFLNANDQAKASDYLTQGLAAAPDSIPNLLKGMALHFRLGKLDQVQKLVDQAKSLAPTNSEVLRWEGQLALINQNMEKAITSLRNAIQYDGKNVKAVMVYIETLLMTEQTHLYQEALNVAKQLIQISSQDPQFLTHYAWALKETGNREEAQQLARQLLSIWNPSPDCMVILAIIFLDPANPTPSFTLTQNALTSDEYFTFKSTAETIKTATERRLQTLKEEKEREEKKREEDEKEMELPLPPGI